jgi:hypothetical protein
MNRVPASPHALESDDMNRAEASARALFRDAARLTLSAFLLPIGAGRGALGMSPIDASLAQRRVDACMAVDDPCQSRVYHVDMLVQSLRATRKSLHGKAPPA